MTDRAHGGTDAGPAVRFDFSTNANPLGPNPAITAALADLDIAPYPDPGYQELGQKLAEFHRVEPDQIVVGAGASELIWRLVAATPGPVARWAPTFGEYAAAAAASARPVLTASNATAFLSAMTEAALGFICLPNNPDGRIPETGFLEAARAAATGTGGTLVVDAAYAPYCREAPPIPSGITVLHAPNKVHGCTGIRAGYAIAPRGTASRLRRMAPSWILGSPGVAFLGASVGPAAREWVDATVPIVRRWRRHLADRLEERGFTVTRSTANFVMVDVGDATLVSKRLREVGIRVRNGTSFGLPRHLRLAAQPPTATDSLLNELDRVTGPALPGEPVR